MSQRVYMSKRRRRDLDSSSSSNSSDCTNDKSLWEFSGDNYEFLMNDDFMEHCKHDLSTMDNSAPVDNSLQSCISLLKDLSHLLHNIRQRSQSEEPENFRKYSETILTNEIQHYERRKNKVVNSILSAVRDKCQAIPSSSSLSSSSPSDALDFTAPTNLISNQEMDQNSSQLLRALGEFQLEWEAIVHQITPVNPLTNKTKFVKDIEQDLQKIDAWLDMLASNLPNTSAWMTCLMSLSEVQKFSAAKYYQICLKQIEQYSKTLSTIKELVDRVDVHTMNADLSFQNTLHHLSKQFCQAEAKCHTLWLRLLELTIYIDQNLKINISTTLTNNNSEQREEKLIENSWNIHLLAFTSQEVKHQNEHESGFESEQSPPVKSSLPYACSETAISSNINTHKEENSLLHKKNSHSLPNDFNKITREMITNSLSNKNNDTNEETRKYPEVHSLHKTVKSTSTSPKNIYNAYNSEHTVCNDNNSNNENIDVISLPNQDNLKLLTRTDKTISTDEKILFDNTSNNSDGITSQGGESFLTDSNNSTDAVLIVSKRKHDNVNEGKQTFPEEVNKIEDLKSNRHGINIQKCSSLPVIISPSISSLSSSSSSSLLSMLSGEEFEILPTSLSIKTKALRVKRTTSVSSLSLVYKRKNNKSFNRHTYTNSHNNNNNDSNIENCTKNTNEQRSFTNKYKAHNLYCLKRLRNRQLKINSSRAEFSLKQKTLKWKSKSSEILKQNLIKQLKTSSSHRNCKSSLYLNKSSQSNRNVSVRHSKSVNVYNKCIESNPDNQMFQSTDFNSDPNTTRSNHSYYCKSPPSSSPPSPSQSSSLPDDASELEQRRWRMQVKTYLNAAAHAEQLIRNKYSPTTLPTTTTATRITEQFKSWLTSVNASSNAKSRNRNNRRDKQSKKCIHENKNTNENILMDVSSGIKLPDMKQSKHHSHVNDAWDSQSQTSTNNNVDTEEEGEDDDNDVDEEEEEASEMKANNKDGDDSNEPLNFWDDYQASLYSNTSDVQAYESPRTYAEEFPWDDDDDSPLFLIDDDNDDDDDGKELKSTSNSCTESFYKLIKSLSNNDSHDGDYGQDTMDIISTSTSALFHLKSNSISRSSSSIVETSLEIDQNNHRNNNNKNTNQPFMNYSQRLESCSPEYASNLLTSPNPSVHGLRTCPDGGSQYLPIIETMDIVSDTNAEGFNNNPVHNFTPRLSSPYSMYHRKQHQKVVPNAYDKKSQTIPRTTFASTTTTTTTAAASSSSPLTATGKTRKRKAQMTLFHSSDSQAIKREFLSFDNNLHCCLQNNRNFSDIHKGILEHSETRLSNAENYLQHLLIAMRKTSKSNRRDRLKRINSDNWRHRTTHLLQTAEAHIKLLSNLLDDLKNFSPDTSEFSEDDHPYSFIEDLTRNTSNNSKGDHLHNNNNNNNSVDIHCQQSQNQSSYQLMISEAMKLKSQWGKFLSKVHCIHQQSNQYEIWEKQLRLLQIRMHELSRLTRVIGLSMDMFNDGCCHHDDDDDDGSDKTVDDPNTSKLFNNAKQMDRISCGLKRCFSELDSLSYALNEIQSELTENCRTSVDSNNNNNNCSANNNTRNNSSMLSSSMIKLDSQLLHETDHLLSQLATNRSILQRLIRLFESNCSSHPMCKHDRHQKNVMEKQLDTATTNESIVQCLQNETNELSTNEHLNVCEPENNPPVISVSNTVENKKSSIFSTILKMLRRIFPFGKHNFLILLAGGFLFIVYMGFYILSTRVICNNNNNNNSASRPLHSSSSSSSTSPLSSSSIPLTSSTSASHHGHYNNHNNNNNFNDFTAATANAYQKCPLDRDRLSNIFDYTNGMPPY